MNRLDDQMQIALAGMLGLGRLLSEFKTVVDEFRASESCPRHALRWLNW